MRSERIGRGKNGGGAPEGKCGESVATAKFNVLNRNTPSLSARNCSFYVPYKHSGVLLIPVSLILIAFDGEAAKWKR